MTCIVACKGESSIVIAGDSAGVAGLNVTIRKDPKVFENGDFCIGFTSSFRMGQILMDTKLPSNTTGIDDFKFMRTHFVAAIKKAFVKHGFGKEHGDEGHEGGTFIVVFNNTIFEINDDFQVGIPEDRFTSVGSGEEIAKGAMYAALEIYGEQNPAIVCEIALKAATRFNAGVRPPFNSLEIPFKEGILDASKLHKNRRVHKSTTSHRRHKRP